MRLFIHAFELTVEQDYRRQRQWANHARTEGFGGEVERYA